MAKRNPDQGDVIVPAQLETSVFLNKADDISIMQVSQDPQEEAQVVVIPLAYAAMVADRILAIAEEHYRSLHAADGSTTAPIDLASRRRPPTGDGAA